MCGRLRRFVFGYSLRNDGKAYAYSGFVERDGVRYLGQSVLFVTYPRLLELREFLRREGVPHVISLASLGPVMTS